jgi:hypothetical protein
MLWAVLRIRIRRIRMFLGLLSTNQRYGSGKVKIVRKTLIPTVCDFFLTLYFVKYCKRTFKSKKQKIFYKN